MITAKIVGEEIEWKGLNIFAPETYDAQYVGENAGKLWYYLDDNKEYTITELIEEAKKLKIDRKCMMRLGKLKRKSIEMAN